MPTRVAIARGAIRTLHQRPLVAAEAMCRVIRLAAQVASALPCFVDLFGGDDPGLCTEVALGTEVEHFPGLADAADEGERRSGGRRSAV